MLPLFNCSFVYQQACHFIIKIFQSKFNRHLFPWFTWMCCHINQWLISLNQRSCYIYKISFPWRQNKLWSLAESICCKVKQCFHCALLFSYMLCITAVCSILVIVSIDDYLSKFWNLCAEYKRDWWNTAVQFIILTIYLNSIEEVMTQKILLTDNINYSAIWRSKT